MKLRTSSLTLPALTFVFSLASGCAGSPTDNDPGGFVPGAVADGGTAHDALSPHPTSDSAGGGGLSDGTTSNNPPGNDAQGPFDSAPPNPVDSNFPGSCNVDSDCPVIPPVALPDGGVTHNVCLPIPGNCQAFGVCASDLGCDSTLQPLCGCDGVTYESACAVLSAGIGFKSLGPCDGADDGGRLGD